MESMGNLTKSLAAMLPENEVKDTSSTTKEEFKVNFDLPLAVRTKHAKGYQGPPLRPEQRIELEAHFNTPDYYPSKEQKQIFAHEFGREYGTIDIWFTDRRRKLPGHKNPSKANKSVGQQTAPISALRPASTVPNARQPKVKLVRSRKVRSASESTALVVASAPTNAKLRRAITEYERGRFEEESSRIVKQLRTIIPSQRRINSEKLQEFREQRQAIKNREEELGRELHKIDDILEEGMVIDGEDENEGRQLVQIDEALEEEMAFDEENEDVDEDWEEYEDEDANEDNH